MQCQFCGPDASAWALGGVIVGLFVALGSLLGWLVRHPSATLALAGVAVVAGLFATGS